LPPIPTEAETTNQAEFLAIFSVFPKENTQDPADTFVLGSNILLTN
jgi:hypothetical protein